MKLNVLAAATALCLFAVPAFAFELPPVFANFEWNPKAFNYEACLTDHAKSYCDAAASNKSISSLSHDAPAP